MTAATKLRRSHPADCVPPKPGTIRKILTHLGEPLEPPPVSPARGPPPDWGEFVQVHDDRDVFQASDRRAARDRYPQPLTAGRQVTTKPRGHRTRRDFAPTARKTPLQGVSQALLELLLCPERPRPRLTSRSSVGNRLRTCIWPGYPSAFVLSPASRSPASRSLPLINRSSFARLIAPPPRK